MERRTRARRRVAPSRVAATPPAPAAQPLANIAQLIEEGGEITVGQLYPIECAAIANDGHNSLAMLRRQPGETLQQLLMRLDAAIALAWNEGRFTDEINPSLP